MKLTEFERDMILAWLQTSLTHSDNDLAVKQHMYTALASEEAAWQEVDRLKEDKRVRVSYMDELQARSHQFQCESVQLREENEQLRTLHIRTKEAADDESKRLKLEWNKEHALRNEQLIDLTQIRRERDQIRREKVRLKSQLDDVINTLQWYADYENHRFSTFNADPPNIFCDQGMRAAEAIQRIKGEGTSE